MHLLNYFSKAYFIYDDDSTFLIEDVESNEFGTKITSIYIEDLVDDFLPVDDDINHMLISVSHENLSKLLTLAYRCDISVGLLPSESQKEEIKAIHASKDFQENIDIALREDSKSIDLIEVNGELVYSQGVIGTVPLIGRNLKKVRLSFFRTLLYAVKKFFSIELQKFEITTQNGQKIVTAGSAIIILSHTKNGLISKIFNFNESIRDGRITIVIISPYSIFEYGELLTSIFKNSKVQKTLPKSIGYIQSESFSIKASSSKKISFESNKSIALPLECKIISKAIKLNASEEFWSHNEISNSQKETVKIANLPDSIEATKYMSKHIPLFKSASEDRFKDLFQILRIDSKLNKTYLILMVISTLLAAFGLFANSAAVIIGAMLIAPLMTPIVSISMGLLRAESKMISDSFIKIGVGILVALLASSIVAYLLPNFEITNEIRARINPTLLDLVVAILSGIAAAYSKSFKEIAQNLAGVAIAVALVPPLAVAGIGLGYGDLYIFYGAFLLFFTNLVGIIIAAVVTFYFLGFSNVIKSKKAVSLVLAILIAISYPLYHSYNNMIDKYKITKMLKKHRFLVNEKYIIVDNATVLFFGDVKVLNLDLAVRESLNRDDFEELKQDIQRLFNTKLFIKTRVEYII